MLIERGIDKCFEINQFKWKHDKFSFCIYFVEFIHSSPQQKVHTHVDVLNHIVAESKLKSSLICGECCFFLLIHTQKKEMSKGNFRVRVSEWVRD